MAFITTSTDVKLSYILTIKDPTSPLLAIMAHGMLADKNSSFLPHLSDHLSINTLRFDHEGNGESEGEFLIGGFQRDVKNILEVAQWARDNGYKPVALIGHSKGANNVLIYDSIHADIPLIVAVSARMNMEHLPSFISPLRDEIYAEGSAILRASKRDFLITKEGIEERRTLKTREIAANGKNRVCVIHGDDDPITPVENFRELCEILGERCFENHLVPSGKHFINEGFTEISSIVQGFFDRTIPSLELSS